MPVTQDGQLPYLTPREVARMLMVSPVTVRHWARSGRLRADTTPGGHRRFLRREIERFARERGVTLRDLTDPRIRVLIVDDDEQFAGFVAEVLADFPDEVVTEHAANGFEAGRKVERFRPDVVMLDIRMPGVDGEAVCEQIKDSPFTKGAKIVAMTGYYSPENARRMLDAGAEACLAKPLEVKAILDAAGIVPERPED